MFAFIHVDIDLDNTFSPEAEAADLGAACARYTELVGSGAGDYHRHGHDLEEQENDFGP